MNDSLGWRVLDWVGEEILPWAFMLFVMVLPIAWLALGVYLMVTGQ